MQASNENETSEAIKDQTKVVGGLARAASLSSRERSAIAAKAATARWSSDVPLATHGSADRPLRIGEIEIPCYVLADGRRVISQRGLKAGLGMNATGGARRMLGFIKSIGVKEPSANDLTVRINSPIKFRLPVGGLAHGYEATLLAEICEAVLDARKDERLHRSQKHIADQCEILVRGFARVGIIALVDEATGYQEIRDRQALQAILDQYLRKEFAAWAKRFPDEFYVEIFRLRKWPWRGMKVNRPQVVAHYTKDLIYARLAPRILKELEARNPKSENGGRLTKHHQWLTEEIGHPALSQLLFGVVGLMRAADTWDQMMRLVDRAYPRRGDSLQLELFSDPCTTP